MFENGEKHFLLYNNHFDAALPSSYKGTKRSHEIQWAK